MEIRRCMKCMHELKPGDKFCPKCGRAYGSWKTESFALKPGTILDGKYLVGEMLGQGGFGITYIGFDLLLEQKVAIKEYFPMNTGMVSRDNRSTVVWSSAVMQKTGAEKGFDSFLKEARKMARLGGIPGVVGVKSVFIQNETAYIVMDFVEGETLLEKLQREGPMDFDTCVKLLTPIMQALAEVHTHGIIHRDISPDNIMVRKDGNLVLLDLGAAKDLDIQGADGSVQSSQLVAKHGFSPIEQYGRNGKVGPWTDIYAMAATVYYCCTGVLPPAAVDRVVEDTLNCQPPLRKAQFNALASCMVILPEKRPRDMGAMLRIVEKPLKSATREQAPPEPKPPRPEPPEHELPEREPPKRGGTMPQWLLPVLKGILIAGALVVYIAIGIGKEPDTPTASAGAALNTMPTEIQTTVPAETAPKETVPMEVHVMAVAENLSRIAYSEREKQPFWGQEQYKRRDVETVTFQSTLNGVPGDAWDVSEAKDRSVLAWMDGSNLHVATEGTIAPNPDASWMFACFENLKEIDFGNCFDTANVTSMQGMFYGCSDLASLDASGFDTANVMNMRYMFYQCNRLAGLDVSGFDTANVTDMGDMFSGCLRLTSLDVFGFDTANVTNMGDMFSDCSHLTSLDVSGFDTANVTDMGNMFYGCSSLASLDVSGFDTANVTSMQRMFYSCSDLTSLDVSGFDTANVTDMQWMFYGCSDFASLDVSGFDTANVIDMDCMFFNCSSLTSLDVSGFDTANVTDMSHMFGDCSSLASLDVSGFDTANVTDMSHMFHGCSSLTSLDVSGFDTAKMKDMDYMFYDCSDLTDFKCTDSRILVQYRNR